MRALMPLSGFPSLRKEMDRFFDRFGDWEFPELRALGEWTPSLDLSETKDAFVVKAETPGIEPKEIQVSLESQVLTIKGEKKQEKEAMRQRRSPERFSIMWLIYNLPEADPEEV